MLKYFRALFEYAKRMKKTHKEIFTCSKRNSTYFYKIEWGVTYWPRVNSLQIYFLVILKKFALCVTMENTHNGEKRRKSEHISINNGPTFSQILSFSTGWVGLGQKTISRYCPFKVYSGFFLLLSIIALQMALLSFGQGGQRNYYPS